MNFWRVTCTRLREIHVYGSRSKKNQKLLQGMKAAVESAEKMES